MNRSTIMTATILTAGLIGCASLPPGGERVVVFLKAKPGAEKVLLDKTREWMAPVRQAEGLEHVSINVQRNDPSTLVLYYHWKTHEHGEAYRKGDLFKKAVMALDPYVAERRIILTDNVE